MKIVSFNIRCGWSCDGINSYPHRSGAIAQKITAQDADIVCFQEVTVKILENLRQILPDYDIYFSSRTEDLLGEGVATAVRKGRFELLELERVWLSDTPAIPGTRYECQSNIPRVCQHVVLQYHKTGAVIRVFNNHLDHINEQARTVQAKQIAAYIKEKDGELPLPIFVLGDFNSPPYTETMTQLSEFLTDVSKDIEYSFHGFGVYEGKGNKIDFIFTDKNTAEKLQGIELWQDESDGIYLSDHYPVCAEFDI